MSIERRCGAMLAAGAFALAFSSAALAQARALFALRSPTFKDGQMMPKKVANMNAPGAATPNPNCVGENISPQFLWTGVPAGTKSFALTMVDPEGRGGAGVLHWVAYGIPPDVTSFAEG